MPQPAVLLEHGGVPQPQPSPATPEVAPVFAQEALEVGLQALEVLVDRDLAHDEHVVAHAGKERREQVAARLALGGEAASDHPQHPIGAAHELFEHRVLDLGRGQLADLGMDGEDSDVARRQPARDHLGLIQPEDGGEAPSVVGGGHVLRHSLEHPQVRPPGDIGRARSVGASPRRCCTRRSRGRLERLHQRRLEEL